MPDALIGYGCEPDDLECLHRVLDALDSPYQLTWLQKIAMTAALEAVIARIEASPIVQAASPAGAGSHTDACPRSSN
jgi:hypothetical protein